MQSSHTNFIDAFNALIYQRMQSVRSYSECVTEWKEQLPPHQIQYLELKSVDVPEAYCEFLLKEFDIWFAKQS